MKTEVLDLFIDKNSFKSDIVKLIPFLPLTIIAGFSLL